MYPVRLLECMPEIGENAKNSISILEETALKVGDRNRGRLKAPFSIATTLGCRGRRYSFPWIAPLYP